MDGSIRPLGTLKKGRRDKRGNRRPQEAEKMSYRASTFRSGVVCLVFLLLFVLPFSVAISTASSAQTANQIAAYTVTFDNIVFRSSTGDLAYLTGGMDVTLDQGSACGNVTNSWMMLSVPSLSFSEPLQSQSSNGGICLTPGSDNQFYY